MKVDLNSLQDDIWFWQRFVYVLEKCILQRKYVLNMDLSFTHLMSTERIIEILREVRICNSTGLRITVFLSSLWRFHFPLQFQRQIQIDNLERDELLAIYNKIVIPLPQRTPRSTSSAHAVTQKPENQLKRKGADCPSEGSNVKVVRNGINELKIQKLKRSNSTNDDPMDGSGCRGGKRKPITWPWDIMKKIKTGLYNRFIIFISYTLQYLIR